MKKSTRGKYSAPLKEVGSITDPHLEELREEFTFSLVERDTNVFARSRLNWETRYCVWAGQSPDGRKWRPRHGEDEVFPWAGSSDARVPLAELYIRRDQAFLMNLWDKLHTTVQGTQVNDAAWAQRMTWFLRWMKYKQMTESRAENALLANYLLERGSAVMGVFWQKRRQLGYEETDLEALTNTCQQLGQQSGDQRWLDLPTLVLDPNHESEAAKQLRQIYDDVSQSALAGVVRDLREQGFARFARPIVMVNRPKLVALAPNEDVFVSPDARFDDDATVFWVETMREAKLRARAKDYGWDPAWTEQVLKTQKGVVEFGSMEFRNRLSTASAAIQPWRGTTTSRKLYLVVYAYRRLADENGVEGIYHTVFHPFVKADRDQDGVGKHELLNYDHGHQPFIEVKTEYRSRRVDDPRGYGEVAHTWQNQIKNEWDNRIDRASIATLPPSHYPTGQQPDKWGPGVQVPTMNPQGYGFFEVPGDPQSSREVEQSVREFANEYFGFANDPEQAADSQHIRQFLGNNWIESQIKIDTQILQLCQQFQPDEFYFRVVGSAQGQPIHATRDEIQGQFDLNVTVAMGDLDPQVLQQKLEGLQSIAASDTSGLIDQGEKVVVMFEMFDPNLGERLLKPKESASQAEVEDEQQHVAVALMAGIPVPVKPGQAYQLRLNTLQQMLQTNATMQQLRQTNSQVQTAVEQRLKDLTFQIQQQQNAVTGRGGPNFAPKKLTQLAAPPAQT